MAMAGNRAGWLPVNKHERGQRLRQRMVDHKMNPTQLAEAFGVSRSNVYDIFNGKAGPLAYEQMESWFDRQDAKARADVSELVPEQPPAPEHEHVVFRLVGKPGIDVVVEGPVENMADLKAAAADLFKLAIEAEMLREQQRGTKSD